MWCRCCSRGSCYGKEKLRCDAESKHPIEGHFLGIDVRWGVELHLTALHFSEVLGRKPP
jgi:hypothetical protein